MLDSEGELWVFIIIGFFMSILGGGLIYFLLNPQIWK